MILTAYTFNIGLFLFRIAKGALGLVLTVYLARALWVVLKKK